VRRASGPGVALISALAAAVCPVLASAEITPGVSLDSDLVQRGVSFSQGRPAASISLSAETASGFYGGVNATSTDPFRAPYVARGVSERAGFAFRQGDALSFDLGVSRSDYEIRTTEPYRDGFTEIYGGVMKDGWSAYLYYSPHYFAEGPPSLYLDLGKSVRLSPRLAVSGHVGVLNGLRSWSADANRRSRYDARIEAVYSLAGVDLRLGLTTAAHFYEEPPSRLDRRVELVAGLSRYF
jgi:uncharacterized protein (TIGR02001 family)